MRLQRGLALGRVHARARVCQLPPCGAQGQRWGGQASPPLAGVGGDNDEPSQMVSTCDSLPPTRLRDTLL